MSAHRLALALVLALWGGDAAAQVRPPGGAIARGVAAERRGDYAEAAAAFESVLRERPTDGQAILGLARVLPPLERRADLSSHLATALAADSTNIGFLALAVRTEALLGRGEAARTLAERWAALAPGDEEPYREWAMSALEARDRATARAALDLGRARLAQPGALAPELAQLLQLEGDLAGATREWLRAITVTPGFRASAVLLLGDLPPPGRAAVRAALGADAGVEARRLEALLLARWGEPLAGAELLRAHLPEADGLALPLLRSFLEELRGRQDPGALRARGVALEETAARQEPDAALRARMDAARAFADGGDEASARRLLARIAADPLAAGAVATSASTTLLGVLIAEGRPAEAESLYAELRPALSLDDREREQRRIAMAWARAGDVARGERLLEGDSTVAGFDARGRLRAFAGDLATATTFLRIAGPWDDSRAAAASRVRLLALLQAVGRDTLPALGGALLALERGDTAQAIAALDRLGGALEPAGAAAVRLLGGELAAAHGDRAVARRLLALADDAEAPAAAPPARLALAALHEAEGRAGEARALLERLILDYPASAVVPAARRARDLLPADPPPGAP